MLYGITMGDASGVGPEILLNAYRKSELPGRAVVYGDHEALQYYNDRLGYGVRLHSIMRPAEQAEGVLNVIDFGLVKRSDVTPGALSKTAGHAAREYVIEGTRAALAGEIDALVTLPMNKEATRLSNPEFTGHTELLGELCGVAEVTAMLASEQLMVTHVSTHVSLAEAIRRVKKDRIVAVARLTCEAARKLKPSPRIAVAGLNPHAGEGGQFGDEEIREIRPAVTEAISLGMPVEGPFPPDTVFYMAVKRKRFDAVVCMYHDQGHVPSKLLDFEGGVNVTLGLPIIRTSVDHGTAFDIAGQGIAHTLSLVRAIEFAAGLAKQTA